MLRISGRRQWRWRPTARGASLWQQLRLSTGGAAAASLQLPAALRMRVKETPLAATYDPVAVEEGWQAYWQQVLKQAPPPTHSSIASRDRSGDGKTFSMILPPPNVTGALHIGHALTITVQDAITRWHRMKGYDVHWIPGLDHAGIATQSVVERKLQKESNTSKFDLGREAFVQEVWKWNEQYGGRIMDQIDHLGAIVKKDQSYFTLDDTRSAAVIDAFVRLHERELIYRRRRMVNWCPMLKTAISDIEVDSEQLEGSTMKAIPGREKPVEFGVMHRIRYQVAESNEFLEVDTTRPETIFGDVAVAVHPDDARYQRFHGKYVLHPFSQEKLPIVTDAVLVNMELGTGVVKITPAHDPKDFECGLRYQLPEKQVINEDGKICGDVDEHFLGLDRFDARMQVIAELKEKGLYVDKFNHPTTLSICSRSGDVIEPLLMPQWFVDCRGMAKRAAENVRTGVMEIEPKSHQHTWFFFLDNIQDWCVSRQLWWGHRIPAYRVKSRNVTSDQWFVARSLQAAREQAEAALGVSLTDDDMEQDVDVLDTWFSSGLLPLSAFGWPDNEHDADVARDLQSKYPLDVMETGSDILFFWVARMAMLCEEFTGQIPFKKVLLHPMVRDKAGRKMSKSLGNVIDPLHVINGISLEQLLSNLMAGNVGPRELKKAEKELKKEFPKGIPTCGTDALRFTLASYLQHGRQINMDLQRVVSYRHFCNKVWNAVRYALPLLESPDQRQYRSVTDPVDLKQLREDMGLADRWILSRLANAVVSINKGIESNQLTASVASIQRFFVQELCDVYIEFSKPVLYGNRIDLAEFGSDEALRVRQLCAQATLHRCLDHSMRLMHPFTPFVTEELWQRIREYDPLSPTFDSMDTSILCATYPNEEDAQYWLDPEAETTMALVLDVIHGIRSLRHTVKVLAPNSALQDSETIFTIVCSDDLVHSAIQAAMRDIESQSRVPVQLAQSSTPGSTVTGQVLTHSVSDSCRVLISVPGDAETSHRLQLEIERLGKRVVKHSSALQGLLNRQSDPAYASKVPQAVQAQDDQRLQQLKTDLHATKKSLAALEELQCQY